MASFLMGIESRPECGPDGRMCRTECCSGLTNLLYWVGLWHPQICTALTFWKRPYPEIGHGVKQLERMIHKLSTCKAAAQTTSKCHTSFAASWPFLLSSTYVMHMRYVGATKIVGLCAAKPITGLSGSGKHCDQQSR